MQASFSQSEEVFYRSHITIVLGAQRDGVPTQQLRKIILNYTLISKDLHNVVGNQKNHLNEHQNMCLDYCRMHLLYKAYCMCKCDYLALNYILVVYEIFNIYKNLTRIGLKEDFQYPPPPPPPPRQHYLQYVCNIHAKN